MAPPPGISDPSVALSPWHYLAVHEHAEGQGDAEFRLLGTAAHATGSVWRCHGGGGEMSLWDMVVFRKGGCLSQLPTPRPAA